MALHIESPLSESSPLNKLTGARVFLKLDSVQPSGSFKIRGIGNVCQKAVNERGAKKLVSSSGGNAGISVAYSARKLGVACTVVVPESTAEFIREKICAENAEVVVHGAMWSIAHEEAKRIASQEEACELVHPFDHPDIWEGHRSMIRECATQMPVRPSSVITVVGGGGLFVGILEGLAEVGWTDVPVFATETRGADSFAQSFEKKEQITLPAITSIAKTLGAARVCDEAFKWIGRHPIEPVVVEDKEAVEAICSFLDDHRLLVEPSCAAGLAILYQKKQTVLPLGDNILVIVCGGNGMNFTFLQDLKSQFNLL